MTAPVSHRPSPADLAHRAPQRPTPTPAQAVPKPPQKAPQPAPQQPYQPRTLTPAESLAPGVLADGERFKPLYQWGLRISGMRPETRLMGYTLLWHAHFGTGHIKPARQPSLRSLADATGLSTARADVQLTILRQRGWLHLIPASDGLHAGRPRYELTIPALYLERLRSLCAERDQQTP